MVEKETVIETIKRMQASGLSDDIIASTLSDIGLSGQEAKQMIAEAKGTGVVEIEKPSPEPAEPEAHEAIAERTAEKVKGHLESVREEDSLAHATAQATIEGYAAKLDEIAKKLVSLEQLLGNVSKLPLNEFKTSLSTIDKKINLFEEDISETKAMTAAMKSILEKILETNRSVLNELQGKKEF